MSPRDGPGTSPRWWIPSLGPNVPPLANEAEEPITSMTGWPMHPT